MMENIIKYYCDCNTVRLIETNQEVLYFDIFTPDSIPADLSGTTAYFHLMEFSTRTHIWTKVCTIVTAPMIDNPFFPHIQYPYRVMLKLSDIDTNDLDGHYFGQLELIDHYGTTKKPFQLELIVAKKAYGDNIIYHP